MTKRDVDMFDWQIKHTLDWAAIDPQTKAVLETLMSEVSKAFRKETT